MKLKDITEVKINNDECVVLAVKSGHEMDLIALGVFSGNETMFRLTKGRTVTCTVFRKDGSTFSWHWGYDGYTLVSKSTDKMGQMIQSTIEQDFGIICKR